jgi:hypothetical protein
MYLNHVDAGVFSALVISAMRSSGSALSLLHLFTMLRVAGSTRNLFGRKFQKYGNDERNRPILAEPLFANLPVAVGQNVVSVDGHGISIVEQAVDEIEASCKDF